MVKKFIFCLVYFITILFTILSLTLIKYFPTTSGCSVKQLLKSAGKLQMTFPKSPENLQMPQAGFREIICSS
jgi:hypothetical protein